jgi:thiamine pyrophosphokinase
VAAQLGLLASPAWSGVALTAYLGRACVQTLHGGGTSEVHGRPGELVSIVPVGGPAIGVRTEGLRFPLVDETLDAFATRGVSNELVAPTGRVSLRSGAVLIITPHALEGDQPGRP